MVLIRSFDKDVISAVGLGGTDGAEAQLMLALSLNNLLLGSM